MPSRSVLKPKLNKRSELVREGMQDTFVEGEEEEDCPDDGLADAMVTCAGLCRYERAASCFRIQQRSDLQGLASELCTAIT